MKKTIIILAILAIATLPVFATKWSRIVNLEGLWHFSVGDNLKWAEQEFDSKNWDRINVPGAWENYYNGYNGFGWYRKSFDMKILPDEGNLVLMLGRIDDVDEVFVNGVKIGQTGSFLPNFETAYNVEQTYQLPEGLLKPANNVIAVRVYDMGGSGGMVGGMNIGIFHDNDQSLLSFDLSGDWKFSVYSERGVYDIGFDDSKWDEVKVPGTWENQGYDDYNGYAWYRKKFILPANLENQELYLVLGKIDDFDKVYFNGSLIGRTEDIPEYSRTNRGRAWQLYRVYKIPQNKLKKMNVLVVEVRDDQLDGGIYEGPVGIMTAANATIIQERNSTNSFWDNPLRAILRGLYIY